MVNSFYGEILQPYPSIIIDRIYNSVGDMNADINNVYVGRYVLVVELENNQLKKSDLYIKNKNQFQKISEMTAPQIGGINTDGQLNLDATEDSLTFNVTENIDGVKEYTAALDLSKYVAGLKATKKQVGGKSLDAIVLIDKNEEEVGASVEIGNNYELPTATDNTLGGVKIGSGINISNGVISVDSQAIEPASEDTLGGIKIGNGLQMDSADTASLKLADSSGLALDFNGLKVNLATNGGLALDLDSNELKINLANNSGLALDLDSNELKINLAADKGLAINDNTLQIDNEFYNILVKGELEDDSYDSGKKVWKIKNNEFDDTANLSANRVYGAVFNDYAEYRSAEGQPGRCVVEDGHGNLTLSIKRLQLGANIISDTFGFAIGQTDKCNTPIAVCGRVLAYPYEDRALFTPGAAVCSGPNGTISLMSRNEIREWPDAIVGYVSEIPDYEIWGSNNINVNGRIWIKVG